MADPSGFQDSNHIIKSELSSFRNSRQMIKVAIFHQLMPRTCYIFTAASLSPGWEIDCILHEPLLTENYSHGFEEVDKGWTVDEG